MHACSTCLLEAQLRVRLINKVLYSATAAGAIAGAMTGAITGAICIIIMPGAAAAAPMTGPMAKATSGPSAAATPEELADVRSVATVVLAAAELPLAPAAPAQHIRSEDDMCDGYSYGLPACHAGVLMEDPLGSGRMHNAHHFHALQTVAVPGVK